jgi:hypothetical protein
MVQFLVLLPTAVREGGGDGEGEGGRDGEGSIGMISSAWTITHFALKHACEQKLQRRGEALRRVKGGLCDRRGRGSTRDRPPGSKSERECDHQQSGQDQAIDVHPIFRAGGVKISVQ